MRRAWPWLFLSPAILACADPSATNPVGVSRTHIIAAARSPIDSFAIAYEATTPNGGYFIFEFSGNGTQHPQITGTPTTTTGCDRDQMDDWSPDGRSIIFDCLPTYNTWIANADGTNPRPLIVDSNIKQRARVSHDGTRIAYSALESPGDFMSDEYIYIANADGTNPHRVTPDGADNLIPSWSPGDRLIVFSSFRTGKHELFTIQPDGTHLTQLTFTGSGGLQSWLADWSPDGKEIVFSKGGFDTGNTIYVMKADGTHQRRLTDPADGSDAPVWSPDGTMVAFHSNRIAGRPDIFIMCSDGSNQTALTNSNSFNEWPKWRPALRRLLPHEWLPCHPSH